MIFEKIRPALFRAVYIHSWLLCASLLLIISVTAVGFSLGADVSEFAPFIFNPPSRNMYLFLFPIPVALFIAFKSRKFLIEDGKVNAQTFLKDYFRQLEQYVTGASFWNAIIALVAMLPIFVFFCLGKSMIPHLFSYTWDPMFADMDKYLHFGYYPHEYLVPIFEQYSLFAVAETVYFAFFIFLVGANGYAIFVDTNQSRRMKYLYSNWLVWVFGGLVLAAVFMSAGPIFYGDFYSTPNPYADYKLYLFGKAETHYMPSVQLTALLLEWVKDDHILDVNAISAMPSMHVAAIALIWLYARDISVLVSYVVFVFMILTIIATIFLGLHYAIDGYAGVLLAWAIWKFSGFLVIAQSRIMRIPEINDGRPGRT